MRVGIYNEPSGSVGGSEYLVSVIADALAPRHDVEIVHHNPDLSIDQLRELSGLAMTGVTSRYVPRDEPPDLRFPPDQKYRDRYRRAREWHAALSRPYDTFINSTHGVPPFCHAPRGVLLTLFPIYSRQDIWPWKDKTNGTFRARLRKTGFNWMWRRRFDSYQKRLSISNYTRHWTKAWWHVETNVLYPPVDVHFETLPKSNLILSVGRFSTLSHSKRQVEMMTAFAEMKPDALRHWCYHSVGGLLDDPRDQSYFATVSRIASRCGAHAVPNIARSALRELYSRASVFWHAAGYGAGADAGPFEAEHFGIATVEAMAAGAVPVVYNHGGQTEIVEHGRSGFLWKSLDELRHYTEMLTRDEALRERMAVAARARAMDFSRDRFVAAVQEMVR